MIALFTFLLVTQTPPLGPVVPPSCNHAFHEAVVGVEEKLEAGDFKGASELARLLPKKEITIFWDDSKVPDRYKAAYKVARDQVLQSYSEAIKGLTFKFGKTADIRFSFSDRLPDDEATGVPKGSVQMFSTGPDDARLDDVISTRRANQGKEPFKTDDKEHLDPTNQNDIHNEIAFAIASYLGLERNISTGDYTFSFRIDIATGIVTHLSPMEMNMILQTLDISAQLRKSIEAKEKVTAAKPRLLVQPARYDVPDAVMQGDPLSFKFEVTNNGNAPLTLRFQPDCRCLNPRGPGVLQPGQTALVQTYIDTFDFVGDIKHELMIYSNDTDFPLKLFPVTAKVKPQFQFINTGPSVIPMTDSGATADVYLALSDSAPLSVTKATLNGLPGSVTYEPWTGTLPDPAYNEPPLPRKGYKFHVVFKPTGMAGRLGANLMIETNSEKPQFKELSTNLNLQKGIAVMPAQVYVGSIAKANFRTSLILSRPEQDFTITKIESDNPFVTTSITPIRGHWEYKITVDIDGDKADPGQLNGWLTIHTSDPKQPEIKVEVRGSIG